MDIHNCLETSLYQLKSIVKFLVTLEWQEFSTVAPSYCYSQLSFHESAVQITTRWVEGSSLFPLTVALGDYLQNSYK